MFVCVFVCLFFCVCLFVCLFEIRPAPLWTRLSAGSLSLLTAACHSRSHHLLQTHTHVNMLHSMSNAPAGLSHNATCLQSLSTQTISSRHFQLESRDKNNRRTHIDHRRNFTENRETERPDETVTSCKRPRSWNSNVYCSLIKNQIQQDVFSVWSTLCWRTTRKFSCM